MQKMNRQKFKKTYRAIEKDVSKEFCTDPDGSYTGKPRDFAKPVQDVDDL